MLYTALIILRYSPCVPKFSIIFFYHEGRPDFLKGIFQMLVCIWGKEKNTYSLVVGVQIGSGIIKVEWKFLKINLKMDVSYISYNSGIPLRHIFKVLCILFWRYMFFHVHCCFIHNN